MELKQHFGLFLKNRLNQMKTKFSIIIDFDSTIIKSESFDCLSKIILNQTKNKSEIIKKISNLTNQGMNGEISFEQSMNERLLLLNMNKNHIKSLSLEASEDFDETFIKNLDFFEKLVENIYIVSGGFKEVIEDAFKFISSKSWNIFGNEFKYRGDSIIGINRKNLLSKNLGKVKLVESLNLSGDVIVVGDGYTDYELKKFNVANYFLCYTRNIKRDKILEYSDLVCNDFNQVVKFIKKNYI
tara:strand:- start:2382 stop:3107 length:726 start_codon:yes stop_codon:yes gene_type:complete